MIRIQSSAFQFALYVQIKCSVCQSNFSWSFKDGFSGAVFNKRTERGTDRLQSYTHHPFPTGTELHTVCSYCREEGWALVLCLTQQLSTCAIRRQIWLSAPHPQGWLLRSHSVSVGSQLYTYKNTTACLPEAVSADIQNKFTLLQRQGRKHYLDVLCTQQGFHNVEVFHHIIWMERDKSSLTLICHFFPKYLSVSKGCLFITYWEENFCVVLCCSL